MLGTADISLKIAATDNTGPAFRSAEAKMKSFAGSAKSMMGTLGLGLSAGVVLGAVKGAIDFGSSLNDAAVATQTNVEALQVYRYAATQAGASTGQLDKALIKLNDSAYAASIGSQAESDALLKLGINAQAFARLAPEKRMEALAQAIVKAKDQNLAMSAAMDLMGSKNAPYLMQVLQKLGKEGFAALEQDAKKAGQFMSKDTIDRLDEAGDSIDKLKTAMTIKTGDTIAFWAQFFDVMKNGSENVKNLRGDVEALVKIIQFLKPLKDFVDGAESMMPTGVAKKVFRESSAYLQGNSGGDRFAGVDPALMKQAEANRAAMQAPASPVQAAGNGIYQDASGKYTNAASQNYDAVMAEMLRQSKINLEIAEKLKEANAKTENALSQIKNGRAG